MWQFLWRNIMKSSNVYTLSLRNKRNYRKSSAQSGQFPCYCDGENSVCTTIWWTFERSNLSIWCTGGILPEYRKTKLELINSERKYYRESFKDMLSSREGTWNGDILVTDIRSRKLDASEIHPRRLNTKVLKTHKDGGFGITCGRWFSIITRKRARIPRTHSETGTHRKDRSQCIICRR